MGASTDALLSGEAIARTAAELIAIPSLGGEEDEVLAVVTRWLTDHGVAVEQRDLPGRAVAIHPFHSAEVDRERIPVLVARVGPAEPTRRLLVNVHVDVVPGAEQDGWTTGPFDPVIRDGLLYGRGSADTKGGLAAAMHVLAALALEPSSLTGEVVLTPVVGEEDGGAGTLASLIAGVRADGAIVVEPTDLAIAPASAGALCFAVTVEGRTAHGSVRHTGVSAIEKAWLVHRRILDLEAERAGRLHHPLYDTDVPFPICMGRIEGGDYRCDEAAWVRIEGRFGTAPDEPVARARAELEQAVAEIAATDPWLTDHVPEVEWIGAQWVGGDTPADDDIVRAVRSAAPAAPVVGMPYGCDLGLLRQVGGIPGVVWGPGSADVAHAPDEHVAVADLERFANMLLEVARTFTAPD